MKTQKSVESRTAVITFADNFVIKNLREAKYANEEANRLKRLSRLMGVVKGEDGWRYGSVKLLKEIPSQGQIYMTRAKGISLGQRLTEQRAFRAGCWLAAFQNVERNDKCTVPLFGDFGPNHVFVDEENRQVTVIDPGQNIGTYGVSEIDLGYMLSSIVLYSFKSFQSPLQMGRAFLDGFMSSKNSSIISDRLKRELIEARRQTERRWKRRLRYGLAYFAIYPYRMADQWVACCLLKSLRLD